MAGTHRCASSSWKKNWCPFRAVSSNGRHLAQAQYLEITTFLSSYLLAAQGDRVAMGHSVEGRFPFLDYRVVEFANRLPPDLKLRGLREKWLLRQFGRTLLPDDIWTRRKRPYRAPIHRSFFNDDPATAYVGELLGEQAMKEAGLFNPQAVAQLVAKARQRRACSAKSMIWRWPAFCRRSWCISSLSSDFNRVARRCARPIG